MKECNEKNKKELQDKKLQSVVDSNFDFVANLFQAKFHVSRTFK